jgi:putative transcriptional regulator
VATVRNWEQSRTSMDPAIRSLLRVVERQPEAALRALSDVEE